MARPYDSSRRKHAAAKTREKILRAAMKLHWAGITEFEPLARAADCSVATLRKHFPTKEALFQNCTRAFALTLTMPDLQALSAIAHPQQRLEQCVSELCRIHEAMFGFAWHSAHLRRESPTLDAEMIHYEGLADAMATVIAPEASLKTGLVRGVLDFLTYRALRLSGNLSPEKTTEQLIAILHPIILEGNHPPAVSASTRT